PPFWGLRANDRATRLLIAFWSNELGGNICEVDELFVVPERRSRGHGKSLFEAISKRDLWPTPVAGIVLGVTPDNVRARRLYERLGCAADGISMVLRLPQGALQPEPAASLSRRLFFGGRFWHPRLKQ